MKHISHWFYKTELRDQFVAQCKAEGVRYRTSGQYVFTRADGVRPSLLIRYEHA